MPDVAGTLRNVTESVNALLTMSRRGRLRHRIQDTLDIYERAQTHPELSQATADLATTIEIEAAALLASVRPATRRRKYPISSSVISLLFAALLGWAAWAVWPWRDRWWGFVLFVLVAVLGGLLFIAGVGMFFERQPTPEGVAAPEAGGRLSTKKS